jgi:hypothetical protein
MIQNIVSLIEYGERVAYGQIPKNDKDLLKKRRLDNNDQDPISLKSYLDTILPPKETTESGQIFMNFVSCKPATTSDVIALSVFSLFSNIYRKNLTNRCEQEVPKKLESAKLGKNYILNVSMN